MIIEAWRLTCLTSVASTFGSRRNGKASRRQKAAQKGSLAYTGFRILEQRFITASLPH